MRPRQVPSLDSSRRADLNPKRRGINLRVGIHPKRPGAFHPRPSGINLQPPSGLHPKARGSNLPTGLGLISSLAGCIPSPKTTPLFFGPPIPAPYPRAPSAEGPVDIRAGKSTQRRSHVVGGARRAQLRRAPRARPHERTFSPSRRAHRFCRGAGSPGLAEPLRRTPPAYASVSLDRMSPTPRHRPRQRCRAFRAGEEKVAVSTNRDVRRPILSGNSELLFLWPRADEQANARRTVPARPSRPDGARARSGLACAALVRANT